MLEVELFWNLAKKLQNSKITLERVLEIMKKEAGWKERRTNAYLCRYNIKADIGRLKSQKRTKRPLNKVKENLNPAEHLVAEKVDYEIQKLQSYGADFIDSENNVIEVKKSLHKYNIKHALLQLIYAKDTLKKVKELKIYTKNYELSQENISTVKRMLNFYKIKIYSFDPEKDKFVKKNI